MKYLNRVQPIRGFSIHSENGLHRFRIDCQFCGEWCDDYRNAGVWWDADGQAAVLGHKSCNVEHGDHSLFCEDLDRALILLLEGADMSRGDYAAARAKVMLSR